MKCDELNRETRCPYAEQVRALYSESLSGPEISQLEEHLTCCPSCAELFDTLDDPSDPVIRLLSTLPSCVDDEPVFRQLRSVLSSASRERIYRTAACAPRQLADPPLGTLPQQLGNYELLERIGRGAWGAVYRARHLKLDQIVAVKVLDAQRLESAHAVTRFVQEMKAAGQLSHPNIVRATDAGEDRGFHYLVMEFVEGIDLARLLQLCGPLPIADACEIVRHAAEALDFAHRRAWIHRDVKPSNLTLTRDGTVKLLDLGLAGRHEDRAQHQAVNRNNDQRAFPVGTPDYMAPEQWANCAEVDARADVYSLGCTLFKLLTDRLPNEVTGSTALSSPAAVRPPSLTAIRPDVKRGLDRLVNNMLAPNPDDRVASAAEVAEALQKWARRSDLPALVSRTGYHSTHGGGVTRSTISGDGNAQGRPLRLTRRSLIVAAVATAAGAAVAVPWFALDRPPRLRRSMWRALAPEEPVILLSLQPRDEVVCDAADPTRIRLQSEDMVLVHLGRTASGIFSMRVTLHQDRWRGGAGIFFRARRSSDGPPACQFQTIELYEVDDSPTPPAWLLLWSRWEVVAEGDALVAQRHPLAEVPVELAGDGNPQQLQTTLGRQGFPEVRWNGQLLHENQWTLSTEARRQQSSAPDQIHRQFVGRLGLFQTRGPTTFLHPQLTYL